MEKGFKAYYRKYLFIELNFEKDIHNIPNKVIHLGLGGFILG